MRLHLRTWGTGPRSALLVHGFSDDATTWWQVGPALADRGFTVLAPDLRGHGLSPRGGGYALADLAADLVDTLPTGVELAVGHSLGAAVLALAVPALAP
ncbi:MAG: alpha/beta fold hydrolase, partial [Mycobacteriales bacterium]